MSSNAFSSPLQQWQLTLNTHGPLALSRISQHFKHTGDDPIELVYQFPLPADAVLQDIAVIINDERLTGTVLPKHNAVESYEEGLENGKRSLLIEEIEEGFYQLSIGNVVQGDDISLEMTVASLLQYQDGRWHYRLPTVLGIKYGNAPVFALPQGNSLFADYGFQYRLELQDAFNLQANAPLSQIDDTKSIWQGEAKLDKPLSLSWRSELKPHQWLTCVGTSDIPASAIGLVYPPANLCQTSGSARLQLLVDCSGSMCGLPMAQAKLGLQNALEKLNKSDLINLVRFGSDTEALSHQAHPYTGEFANTLRQAINALEANLGGTELHKALVLAQELALNSGGGDILLCTDGELWDSDNRLRQLTCELKSQGIRLFTIGIGNSASEPLLRRLAQATGGNSLMLNPHINMAEQLTQLIEQLRSPRLQLNLPQLTWQSLPSAVFSGCTTAFYQSAEELPPQLSGTISNPQGELIPMQWQQQQLEGEYADALRKLVAQQQLRTASPQEAEVLALKHQLLSSHTSFVLVQEQVVTDDLATTVVIPHMLAEGSVCMSAPEVYCESAAIMSSPHCEAAPGERLDTLDIPAFLRSDSITAESKQALPLPSWVDMMFSNINALAPDTGWFLKELCMQTLIELGFPEHLARCLSQLESQQYPVPHLYIAVLVDLEARSSIKVPCLQELTQFAACIKRNNCSLLKVYQDIGLRE
ncbi:VIT and vWA domain-containing protein [Shewanella sp. GXUN23E]|uniref:VIT and vWA domain-containing protein n=1 Tax=Shewanella sp. GXUN23E TaxID=3422498 RepID=UPI003D7C63A4